MGIFNAFSCSVYDFLCIQHKKVDERHSILIIFAEAPLIFTVASDGAKDGYQRFLRSAEQYDLDVSSVN